MQAWSADSDRIRLGLATPSPTYPELFNRVGPYYLLSWTLIINVSMGFRCAKFYIFLHIFKMCPTNWILPRKVKGKPDEISWRPRDCYRPTGHVHLLNARRCPSNAGLRRISRSYSIGWNTSLTISLREVRGVSLLLKWINYSQAYVGKFWLLYPCSITKQVIDKGF